MHYLQLLFFVLLCTGLHFVVTCNQIFFEEILPGIEKELEKSPEKSESNLQDDNLIEAKRSKSFFRFGPTNNPNFNGNIQRSNQRQRHNVPQGGIFFPSLSSRNPGPAIHNVRFVVHPSQHSSPTKRPQDIIMPGIFIQDATPGGNDFNYGGINFESGSDATSTSGINFGSSASPGAVGISYPQFSANFPTSGPDSNNGGGLILFPGQNLHATTSDTPIFNSNFNDEDCKIEASLIYFNGRCERILADLPCKNPGYWLVLNDQGIPFCKPKTCPFGQLRLNSRCRSIDDDSACPINEIMYTDYSGRVFCDCEPDYVYDGTLNKCIAEHQQGSCPTGTFLESSPTHGTRCVSNPCQNDKQILNPDNGRCYLKKFIGLCKSDMFHEIKFKNGIAECISKVGTRNIFEVPALTSCPYGSRRDYLGKCQRVVRFGNTNPFSYRVPSVHTSRYTQCPYGYTKYPNGSCKKTNAVLG